MDITDLSSNMAQSRLMSEVSTAVLAKTLENTRAMGQETQQLIADSAQPLQTIRDPALGNSVNLLV